MLCSLSENGSSSSSLFLFASKKTSDYTVIEDKIEQRLQIKRRELNDIRYNMHKKLCMVTAPVFINVWIYGIILWNITKWIYKCKHAVFFFRKITKTSIKVFL